MLTHLLSINDLLITLHLHDCMLDHVSSEAGASAWLHTCLQVVGFSGTNDNRSLLPLQVRAQDTEDDSIKGTNGRMVDLLLQPGKCSFHCLPSPDDDDCQTAVQVLDLALELEANALIDAGTFMLPPRAESQSRPGNLHVLMHSAGGLSPEELPMSDPVSSCDVYGAACLVSEPGRTAYIPMEPRRGSQMSAFQ